MIDFRSELLFMEALSRDEDDIMHNIRNKKKFLFLPFFSSDKLFVKTGGGTGGARGKSLV